MERVPVAANPNTVREIFLPEARDWDFALWSAGAALPLWLRSAPRSTPSNSWSPVAKAPSRPARSKAEPPEPRASTRVEQIYAGQYWASRPVPGLGTGRQAARGTPEHSRRTLNCRSL